MGGIDIQFILGNIIGFLCELFCILSTFSKTHKQMMLLQCMDCMCGTISNIILGGYSGATTQFINLLRNVIIYKDKMTNSLKIISIVLIVAVGILVNNHGLLGLLPILASTEYGIIAVTTTNVNILRFGMAVNNIMWIAYELVTKNYGSCILSLTIVIVSFYNIIKSNLSSNMKRSNVNQHKK